MADPTPLTPEEETEVRQWLASPTLGHGCTATQVLPRLLATLDAARTPDLTPFRCEPCWDYIAAHHASPDADHVDEWRVRCVDCHHEWRDHGPHGCEVRYSAGQPFDGNGMCACTEPPPARTPDVEALDVERLARALVRKRAGVRTSWEGWLDAARDLAAEYAALTRTATPEAAPAPDTAPEAGLREALERLHGHAMHARMAEPRGTQFEFIHAPDCDQRCWVVRALATPAPDTAAHPDDDDDALMREVDAWDRERAAHLAWLRDGDRLARALTEAQGGRFESWRGRVGTILAALEAEG